jgi:mono/diheme cytochrome c family protein
VRPRLGALVLAVFAACTVLALLAAACVVCFGLYDVSASEPHTQPVYSLLEATMRRSVQRRAGAVAVPALDSPALLGHGAACYREHCVQCHGGPGVAPGPAAKGMQPLPGWLSDESRRWRPRELYWIVRDGLKMTGMPAWGWRLGERDLWSVVAFVDRMPALAPAQYATAIAAAAADRCAGIEDAGAGAGASSSSPAPEQGRIALQQYGCVACHAIPGLAGSDPQLGPPLDALSRRPLIAGRLPNSQANLVRWIRTPHSIDPNTVMPDLGVSEEHARAMVSYLWDLR